MRPSYFRATAPARGRAGPRQADDTHVTTLFPDEDARAAFGNDVMSPQTRRPAALAGFAQGRLAAAAVAECWG